MDDIDIFQAAAVLIKQHGDEAPLLAIKRATKMLNAGDVDGYAVWKRIVDAINDMQRDTPRPGEHRHCESQSSRPVSATLPLSRGRVTEATARAAGKSARTHTRAGFSLPADCPLLSCRHRKPP